MTYHKIFQNYIKNNKKFRKNIIKSTYNVLLMKIKIKTFTNKY